MWKPHKGPQTEAFRYPFVYEILYGGAKGGGKTDWLLFDFYEPELIKQSNYRGIIFRRTSPRLTEIIDRSLIWFWGIAEWHKSEKYWEFPSGAKLYFRHCQYEEDKYNYQGHEYQYMGFDQIEEFTESQYEYLKVQARTSNPQTYVRIRATANPGNVGHLWVKRRFIDDIVPQKVYKDDLGLTKMYIPAKVYDNPALIDNDPLYVKRLEALPEKERKALLEGDWNIFSGQYFNEWTPSKHIIKPFYIPEKWNKFIALDYGYKNPSSVGWYTTDDEGNVYRYKELYKEQLHYDTLAQEILDITGEDVIDYAVADPAIFGDQQHHQEARETVSGAQIMQEVLEKHYGVGKDFSILRADNRRLPGWATVRQYLKFNDNEEPKFKVFSTCTHFIKTFPANIHDERKPEDLDTKGEDHTADETRYGLASRPEMADLTYVKPIHPNSPLAMLEKTREARTSKGKFHYHAKR